MDEQAIYEANKAREADINLEKAFWQQMARVMLWAQRNPYPMPANGQKGGAA